MPWLWQVVLGPSPSLLGTQYIHLKIHLQWRGSLEPICLVQISGLPLTVTLTNLWHPRASDKVVMTGTRRLLQGLAVIIVTQTARLCIWVFLFYFVGREELAAKTDHWLILRLKASPLRSWTCPILELCNWLVNLEAKTWNCIFPQRNFREKVKEPGEGGGGNRERQRWNRLKLLAWHQEWGHWKKLFLSQQLFFFFLSSLSFVFILPPLVAHQKITGVLAF